MILQKKTPVEPKRGYNKIDHWQEGCPYCDKKPLTYTAGGFIWCDRPFYLVNWPQEKWVCDFHDDGRTRAWHHHGSHTPTSPGAILQGLSHQINPPAVYVIGIRVMTRKPLEEMV